MDLTIAGGIALNDGYRIPRFGFGTFKLAPGGEAELLKTVRHEAFHQYLSYAGAMNTAAPWFNEGYAQYFEDEESSNWGAAFPDGRPSKEELRELAKFLPSVFAMDYAQFYSGTPAERSLKYRLAWSVARFIEKGASEVRFQPYRNLKRDYMAELLKTGDMAKATEAAFGGTGAMKRFIADWEKYWL